MTEPAEFQRVGATDLPEGLDPAAAQILLGARARPSMDQVGVAASRVAATKRATAPPREEVHEVREHLIPVADGEIAARTYHPVAGSRLLPAIVYYHAGGWILGDLEHSDHLCRRLANRAGAVVLNVDYRLAPEHPYPIPVDDSLCALAWLVEHAEGLGLDRGHVAVAGESSGGGLASAVALRTLAAGDGPPLAAVLLLCPALDPAMATDSWADLGRGFLPPRSQMSWMWTQYLAATPVQDYRQLVEPGPALQLADHPPTVIVTAEFDPLRDEAEIFGERLRHHGVDVLVERERGLIHAFSNLGGVLPAGAAAFDRAVDDLVVRL